VRIVSVAGALALGALASSCIVEAPGGQKATPERARAVVSQVPPLSVQSGANLGDQVEIVGATIQPGRVLPGESAKVTVFFKVLQELDVDYIVFVHVEDSDGRAERLNADHRPAGGYSTTQWKAGETVKDEFSVYVPPGMSARALNLFMGLWDPKTDTRLPLRNPDKVRSDGHHRILLAQIPVGS
jgi:hypothetical protein